MYEIKYLIELLCHVLYIALCEITFNSVPVCTVLNVIFLPAVSYHYIKVIPETDIAFFCKDSVLQFVYLQLIFMCTQFCP